MQNPLPFFATLADPRIERGKEHALTDIIFLTMAAVLCGCGSWDDIEEFGRTKEAWLRRFSALQNGIPSHDTINRVFAALDPDALQGCFPDWIREVSRLTQGHLIAIDGKTMRPAGSGGKKAVVYMLHAWSEANGLLPGQKKTEDKSNEITASPALLELLELRGCIVTLGAAGCQRGVAASILKKGADYVLCVKDNQGRLLEDIREAVERSAAARPTAVFEQTEAGHGRIEHRCCRVLAATEDDLRDIKEWEGLKTIAQVERRRTDKASGAVSSERRYFISSLCADAAPIAGAVRSHRAVETSLHWSLDVVFGEDYSTKAAGNAAQNFGLITRMALSMLKADKTSKRYLKGKRLKAGWDSHYLEKLLAG